MANNKLIISDAVLIAACAYGFIGGGVSGKKYAVVALILYLASGIFNVANELTNNNNIRKCDHHCFYVSNTCGIDLLVTEICILSSVDEKLALLNLIPPAVDLIMWYASENWDPITPMTHIVSIGLMGYFAFKDSKYILIVSGVAFLFSIFGTKNDERYFVNAFNALGVFASSWFLGGKDLKDMGIDIG
uniref:Uncharacterized protein n=1 Tax=Lygus hesperus TaxID=30085 RepID=A0A0A9YSS8_LYGHE